jgi:hypothetical protein
LLPKGSRLVRPKDYDCPTLVSFSFSTPPPEL